MSKKKQITGPSSLLPDKAFHPIIEVATALAKIRGSTYAAARSQIYRGIESGEVTTLRHFGVYTIPHDQAEKIIAGDLDG